MPVTGTAAGGDPFQGILDVSWFQVKNGQLMALGTLTGTVTVAVTGAEVARVSEPVSSRLTGSSPAGACQVLNGVLGPLHQDLPRLVIHLNEVFLTITAVPGAGNLLGNLLCAVAGLLDGPLGTNGLPKQVANLLNRILGAVGDPWTWRGRGHSPPGWGSTSPLCRRPRRMLPNVQTN